MDARNPSLLQAIFEGGKPPEVDVQVNVSGRTIRALVFGAVMAAIIILIINKHFFKS